jgi:hypothetical protein
VAEGLSERDRRRLEEGRAWAAKKLAEERERQAKNAQRDAERAAQAERAWNEHVARFGPKDVVTPDGLAVRLTAKRSGPQPEGPNLMGADDPIGCLIAVPIYFLGMLATVFVNWIVFRGGWTLHVEVAGQKTIKLRLKSRDAATRQLHEVADAVRLEGLAAVTSRR